MPNIIYIAIIICISFSSHVFADEYVTQSDRVKHYISVRNNPETNSDQIAELRKHQKIKLVQLKLHSINIGPGACTLVECPDDNTQLMIIDCGSHWEFKTDTGKTAEETKDYINITRFTYTTKPKLVLSHIKGICTSWPLWRTHREFLGE